MENIELKELLSQAEVMEAMDTMNGFGPRYTGSAAHKHFIEYLKGKVSELGLPVYEDKKNFFRWQSGKTSLVVHGEDGDRVVNISSPYPYSGETGPEGVTGKLDVVVEKHIGFLTHAKDKICICKVDNLAVPTILVEDRRNSMPEGIDLPRTYGGPVLTTFVNFPFLKVAKMSGAKAVVCVWNGFSDDSIQGQYLPFILDYQGMPAIWVNGTEGKKLMKDAKEGKEATLILEAETEPDCETETFYSIIEGENTKEAIIINTHTDGVNCVEENGAIGLLSMMRYFKAHKPKHSMIFVFMTGHFRLPALKAPGAIQCTSRWLEDHKELWDGKDDHVFAMGGLTVEHLGCKEFTDNEGHNAYMNSNPIDIEMCYTSNEVVDKIYFEALETRTKVRTITYRGCNALHFGEGQPLFDKGIPTIALVPGPSWLCVVDEENHCMDKFDVELMLQQIETFTRAAVIMDSKSPEELGRADGYSFGIIDKAGLNDVVKTVQKVATDVGDKIGDIAKDVVKDVAPAVEGTVNDVVKGVQKVADDVSGAVKGVIEDIFGSKNKDTVETTAEETPTDDSNNG